MTARSLSTAFLALMLGFSTTLLPQNRGTGTEFTEPASDTASYKDGKSEVPENVPSPKAPSCQDTCLAEGWDAEECHLECTWVASSSETQNLYFTVAQH